MLKNKIKCGYVAIVGRPNVGKSTLLNTLLHHKVSITSRKPQTTRHKILGIKNTDDVQIIYVDTPGIHMRKNSALNKQLNKTASNTVKGVDVILMLCEAVKWNEEDEKVLKIIENSEVPIILAINKIDNIPDKLKLLPYIEKISSKYNFNNIIPISAQKSQGLAELEKKIINYLPQTNSLLFAEDQITDKSARFYVAEVIREKLMRLLGDEIPYSLSVEIEELKTEPDITRISAIIWTERVGQKSIIIGKDGIKLKEIGTQARLDLEKYFNQKVFLKLWVKVRSGWSDDLRAVRSFGYE